MRREDIKLSLDRDVATCEYVFAFQWAPGCQVEWRIPDWVLEEFKDVFQTAVLEPVRVADVEYSTSLRMTPQSSGEVRDDRKPFTPLLFDDLLHAARQAETDGLSAERIRLIREQKERLRRQFYKLDFSGPRTPMVDADDSGPHTIREARDEFGRWLRGHGGDPIAFERDAGPCCFTCHYFTGPGATYEDGCKLQGNRGLLRVRYPECGSYRKTGQPVITVVQPKMLPAPGETEDQDGQADS